VSISVSERMRLRMTILQKVNAEAEKFYESSKDLGTLVERALRSEEAQKPTSKERHRAQMTGLENVAESAMKYTDILDYIKKQFARQGIEAWRKDLSAENLNYGQELRALIEKYLAGQGLRFGQVLIVFIEHGLKGREDALWKTLPLTASLDAQEQDRYQQYIYLALIRQCIRQLVVQYEYLSMAPQEKHRHAQ
jgi:hypothetical protein